MTLPVALVALSLALGVAACGDEDTVSAQDAERQASALAEQTQQLAGDVARTARTLADDPDAAEAARERLAELEAEARDLADEAQELPDPVPAREELQQSNERIAQAAERLADASREQREQALDDARAQLERAADQIDAAAGELGDELPQRAREALDAPRRDRAAVGHGHEPPP
jgi:phosphoglycerate-specific signal transduction histidine kinase